mmetsp:Transcript_32971/g.53522  ORF Transcript_32971/g.53522 Transcript_32971/m.53522 type:complete len:157 (+) Transcript_32971:147-617(+)
MHSPVLVGLVLVVLAVASLCDLTFKIILVLEVVYLAYFALQLTPRLQRSLYEPPSISNPARLLLWQRCLNSVPSVLEFTESWFRFTADDDDDDDGDDDDNAAVVAPTRRRGGGGGILIADILLPINEDVRGGGAGGILRRSGNDGPRSSSLTAVTR